jgi:hypothetical protein
VATATCVFMLRVGRTAFAHTCFERVQGARTRPCKQPPVCNTKWPKRILDLGLSFAHKSHVRM